MHGFGFGAGRRRYRNVVTVPNLSALTLSAATLPENSAAGVTVGVLAGKTAGSTLSLAVDAGGRFALAGNAVVAGLVGTNFEAATSHTVTVRETLAGSPNSPRDSVFTITVTNVFEQPNLGALTLSATSFVIGTPASGAISGATVGSGILASGLPSGLTIDGAARTWAWSGVGSAGSASVVLTETLADSANSPRASTIAVTVSAPTAAGYLSAAVAPYAAYGAQRVVAGYSGNLFQLRRASDAAVLDVAVQPGGDYPDYAAIATWAGTSAVTVATIYDQSGNARHLTQAVVANQPSFDVAQKVGNVVPILIDGQSQTAATGSLVAKTPTATGLTLDVISNSAFICAAPNVTQNPCGYFEWQDSTATSQQGMHSGSETMTLRTTGTNEATTTAASGVVPRAQLDVFGAANSATQSVIWANGLKRTTGHTKTSVAVDRIKFGASAAGGTTYNGKFKLYGAAFYNSTLSTTNGDAVESSLKTAFGYSTAFPYRVVFGGDSIMEGTGCLLLKNIPNQLGLTRNAEIYNLAVHGQTLTTEQGAQVARYGSLFTASYPCVAFIQGGTNDIFAGTGVAGSTLYTTATSLVTYLKGLGFKVVICTLLPQTNSVNYTATKETQRLAYNTAVRGNAAAADLVLDLASDAAMGDVNAPLDTAKYVDKIHPTTAGYGLLAPLYKAALQTVLRTTSLGASYVP